MGEGKGGGVMARYEHLPIYKKAMDVAVHFEKVVAGFSQYHKYTLGTELRNKSREIVSLIVESNSTADRLPCLLDLRERIEELIILVRLCKEVRAFKSFKSFQFAVEDINSVSRQNEGWIKSAGKEKRGPESSKSQEELPSSFG